MEKKHIQSRLLPILLIALLTILLVSCGNDSPPPTAEPIASPTPIPQPTLEPTPTAEPLDLTTQESDSLAALGRLYALIRYFHPSDQAAAIREWDTVLMNAIEAVRGVETPSELAAQLNDFFAPIAPTVQVYLTVDSPLAGTVPLPDTDQTIEITMWNHEGVRANFSSSPYKSERVAVPFHENQIPEGFRDPQQPYTADLGGGLAAVVPVSLYQDINGTYPAVSLDSAPLSVDNSFDLQTHYLAANIMYWSVIRHFYPYLDVIDTDWEAILSPVLAQTLAAEDETALEERLFRLVALSQDGHGGIYNSSIESLRIPLIQIDWVENQLVVIEDQRVTNDPLPPGTIITKIDGEDTQSRMAYLKQFVSGATDQWLNYRAKFGLLAGPPFTKLTLDIRLPDATEKTIVVQCSDLPTAIEDNTRPSMVEELSPGIFYIDLTRINNSQIIEAMSDLETADGILFDMRGYPGEIDYQNFLFNLVTDHVSSAQFLVPETRLPNQEAVTFTDYAWDIVPRRPKLTDNIVFLTDGRAISYAESILGVVEYNQLGQIVGQPTAGTNGNINYIDLPTGHRVGWTGMLVLKQDGSQHHGIGIQPTIIVSPTIAGITAGIDEQLEAALALLTE